MKMIPELFAILKSAEVEIKKEHQVLMVNKTTSFNKKGKGKKGNFKKNASKLLLQWRSPKLDQSLKLSASTTKEMVTRSRNALNIWWIWRMAKWTRVYLIYRLLMCTLLVFIVAPGYLILVQLVSNSKQELQNEQRLVKGEVTMCVGSDSKVDKITIAHSLYLQDWCWT